MLFRSLSKQSIHLTFITDASTSIQNNKFEFVLISNNYVINSENLSKQIFKNIDLSDKPLVYINDSVDECLREIKSIIQKEKIIEPVTILDHEEQIDDSLLKGKKIMVVDDDVRNIYSLTSILEEKEMIIQTAFSGNEAIEKLKSEKVDIIIMDIMMPEKNGYETIQEIRLMKEYSNLPIIAVTAKAMKGDKELCINAGANDYLTKPIQTDLLIKKIKQQLNINKHENA